MQTPQMFTGIRPTAEQVKAASFHWPSFLGKVVAIIAIITILLYVGLQLFGFVSHVAANWQEIQFAYNKPAVVHAVRTQYESKAVALDNQFIGTKQDEQTAMLKQIQQALTTPSK